MNKISKFLKKPQMLRLTLARTMKKSLVALVLVLLWSRFVNRDMSILQVGFFAAGVFLFVMAWFSYLGLDGLKGPWPLLRNKNKRTASPKKKSGDMIDYVEEDVVTMDELSDEERHICGLLSSLLAGAVFFVPSIIASL